MSSEASAKLGVLENNREGKPTSAKATAGKPTSAKATAGKPTSAKAMAGKPTSAKAMAGKAGITAVVGPNGSGKSNVADAIRWVMGEQSTKALRGKKSHDVIFAGTKGKARLSSAQVTLFFDNSDKKLPVPFTEVSVMRKIYRDGEGEYRINGSKARLMDVVDTLAAAGIGKESHCVLNQGMSDAVLNANPFERRSIVEEAAGVKPYQLKRERSLRKLQTAQENIEQSRAIIAEIEPRLRILGRQVNRARERESVERELKNSQTKYYGHLWRELENERQHATDRAGALGREVKQMQRKADTLYEKRRDMAQSMSSDRTRDELEDRLASERRALSESDRELAVAQTKLDIEKERKKSQRFTKSIPVDLHFVREELKSLEELNGELADAVAGARDMEALADIGTRVRAVSARLKELHENCGKKTVEVRREQEIIDEEKIRFEKHIRNFEVEIGKLSDRRGKYSQTVKELEEKIRKNSEGYREMNASLLALEQEVHTAQRQMDTLKDRWNEAKVAEARVDARQEDMAGAIRAALGCDPDEMTWRGEKIDTDEEKRRMEKLERKLSQIGGIDPLVEEEYEEAKERHDFLLHEVEDLESAIESLSGIVKEMDRRIEKEFSKAFERINKEFDRYFKLIFDGGSAQLAQVKSQKLKAENEEEARLRSEDVEGEGGLAEDIEEHVSFPATSASREVGIEISVSPPRKKIHNLAMMSGGERSLVSLALLFAIISYNPPPFAVLDEVEAALDESNSRRFSLLLKDLAKKTQFIVITHNRETMQEADVLYGVTMGGDGVSNLLSVKMS